MLAPDFTPPAGFRHRKPTPWEDAKGPRGVDWHRFDDWTAWTNYATAPALPGFPADGSTAHRPRKSWDLSAGWDGACAMATSTGWPEGRARMAKAVEGAATLARFDTTPAAERWVAGAYPIVPIAIAGDPCAMVMPADLDTSRRPIVRVVCNTSRSASVPADAIANLFGAVLSCVDAMEAAGQSVELTTLQTYSGPLSADPARGLPAGKGVIVASIMLKRAGEPLELDRVAFALAHPAQSRRLGFRFLERQPGGHGIAGTYGWPTDLPGNAIEPGTIYIPAQLGDWADVCADPAFALAHALHYFNNPTPHPEDAA